jgi:LysM repeat protein
MRLIGFVLLLSLLAGCSVCSPNSRNSLLAGDADLALYQSRTSKNVSKMAESDGTNSGASTTSPSGGGTITLDPGQLGGLIGAVVKAQAVAQPTTYVSTPSAAYYTVEAGDCLWNIAQRNSTTIEELQRLNNLSGTLIKPGQSLRIR